VSIRWLFRGIVSVAGSQPLYVAVFLIPAARPDQNLVLAYAARSDLDDNGNVVDGSSTAGWAISRRPVLLSDTTVSFSLAEPTRPGQTTPPGVDFLVLADPTARTLHVDVSPLPHAQVALGPGLDYATHATLASPNGVFVGRVPVLDGPLITTIDYANGHSSTPIQVGTLGVVAALAPPPAPQLPSGSTVLATQTGQIERFPPTLLTQPLYVSHTSTPDATMAVYVRCYGAGALTITFETPQGTRPTRGSAACDGRVNPAIPRTTYPAMNGFSWQFTGDSPLVFVAVLGTVG
jgi:hypothetical protein